MSHREPPRGAFDLYCFDLDGTLVETAPEILDATNDLLACLGLPLVSQPQVERWIGHGTRELLVQALAHATGSAAQAVREQPSLREWTADFDVFYASRCGTRSRPYPHAREVLQQLRARHARLAVVTNKEGSFARKVLQAHGLDRLVDRLVAGDSLPQKKPHPMGLHSCMAQFGAAPARTLMVGDSSIDVDTGRNAGVAVWAVDYGYNMGQPIATSRPDRVIGDLRSLVEEDRGPVATR